MQNTPSPGSQRGAIRPPARERVSLGRPEARPPVRRPGSMDGVVVVPKPEETPVPEAPAPVAPANAYTYAPGTDIVAARPKAPAPAYVAPEVKEEAPKETPAKVSKRSKRKSVRSMKRAAKKNVPEGTISGGRKFNHKKFFLVALAIIVLLLTGYIAYDTWLTNSRAQAVLTSQPASSNNPTGWSKDAEGKDETEIPKSALSSYTVGPTLPRALYIEKLNIAARVMPMSINTDNSIQAPKNIFDSGWYNGSVKPGETGAMFIDGHASGSTRQGLFAYLDTLQKGDKVQIEKGDGTKLNYKVVNVETVPLADVDMKKVLLPYGNASRALNLMTCTGKWLPKDKTYDHRVIVYTEQV